MKKALYIFGLILIASCTTQKTSFDYDRNQDFSQIRDYRIQIQQNSMSELSMNRIEAAILEELSAKSMTFNESSENLIQITTEEFVSETAGSNIGISTGSYGGSFGTSIGVGIPITSKKLNQRYLVSIFNSANQLIWEGKLDVQTSENVSSEVLESSVRKGIQKLFKDYPPKK